MRAQEGVSSYMMRLFRFKVGAIREQEKMCAVVFDKMAIKCGLSYDPVLDQIEGLGDYGISVRSKKHAVHGLVAMVRSQSMNGSTQYHMY